MMEDSEILDMQKKKSQKNGFGYICNTKSDVDTDSYSHIKFWNQSFKIFGGKPFAN